ncbi:MAG: hypothetical protein GX456_06715 [Verrucomicrobia bacterium]|nr:hypothetical protein [Verrucomicrobiota bacterium]
MGACDDPHGDKDADGQSNLSEYFACTDPRSPASCVRLAATRTTNTDVRLRWPANPAQRYRVFTSTDLCNWYLLGTPVVGDGAEASVTVLATVAGEKRFYRIQALPK